MTHETNNDKRQFHRIFYHSLATVTTDTTVLPCEILDLSLKGCLLRFDQPWNLDPEKTCELKLQLSEEICISMELLLTHNGGHEIGFRCKHIDINSITELKRLVELNLGNSELLERDMHALVAGKF